MKINFSVENKEKTRKNNFKRTKSCAYETWKLYIVFLAYPIYSYHKYVLNTYYMRGAVPSACDNSNKIKQKNILSFMFMRQTSSTKDN